MHQAYQPETSFNHLSHQQQHDIRRCARICVICYDVNVDTFDAESVNLFDDSQHYIHHAIQHVIGLIRQIKAFDADSTTTCSCVGVWVCGCSQLRVLALVC